MRQNSLLKSLYPWVVFALSSSFLFYKYLLQVSPSAMVPELMASFHLTGASLGNLAAFYFYAYLCMQLPVGLLLDHFSPKRLVAAAIAVCAIGALLFANAQQLGTANLGRLLIGLGGAFSAVGTMKLITLWFPAKRFALVSGLMMTIGMLGAVFGETTISYMVTTLGWRHTIVLCAILGFVLAVCVWIFILDRRSQHKVPRSLQAASFFSDLSAIIKNKQSWLISIYSGLAFAPISAFAGLWGIPFLEQTSHFSKSAVVLFVPMTFIGFAIGSPLAGWISDRIKRRKPMMILGTLLGLLCLSCIIYLPMRSATLLVTLLFFFGFFTSFFFVSFAYMREINHAQASGTAIGFINMFNAICGALSEPIIGKLLDLGWDHKFQTGERLFSLVDYRHSLVILPLCMVLALILQLFIKETYCQPKN
jgi:MFS family permease